MSNLNELRPIQALSPFKRFCCTIGNLPSSYVESMSYMELVYWLCDYLQNTVIPAVNNNANAVLELQNLYVELKNYVDNYFNNLDVQEEINQKLDDMVETGELQRIIFERLDFITYELFGAKLNGENDDTQAVIAAHNYANQYNLKVVQKRGILYMPTASLNNCPIVNTDCDFSGLIMKFDSNNDNKTIMIIADENTLNNRNDINQISLTNAQISYLTKSNTNSIPFLEDYKKHLVTFETDMNLGVRNDLNSNSNIFYKQPFIVNDYAQLAPNNMYTDMSNSTSIIMRYLPLNQSSINIKFGEILIHGIVNNNPQFLIMRNNVNIEGGFINKDTFISETTWKQPLFNIKYSANVTIEKFQGFTPVSENPGNDITAYTFSFEQCYNIDYKNNDIFKGHGTFVSYFCNNIKFDNNKINRFDCHYGLYGNINIDKCSITGYPARINLGFGNAIVNITSSEIYKFDENSKNWIDDIINFRNDLGVMFSGTVNIKNLKITGKQPSNNNNYITLFQFISNSSPNTIFPEWADYNMPKITINNIDWFLTNLSFRLFRIYNNNNNHYILNTLSIKLNNHLSQSRSLFYGNNIVIPSNTFINLENTDVDIRETTSPITLNIYKGCVIYSTPDNTIVNSFENNITLNGNFATIHNNGNISISNNSIINTLNNYARCAINGATISNLYNSGYILGSLLTITNNAFISGIFRPTSLINNGQIYFVGCYINFTNLTNTNGTIILAGCNMYSSIAEKFNNNGTIVGNGNYAGANSSIINTL